MAKHNVAILGVSGIAERYATELSRLNGVRVLAVHSRSEERARLFANNHRIPNHSTDLETVLKTPGLDSVLIASEPGRHLDQSKVAVKYGLHTLIEKPVSTDLVGLFELSEMALQKGLTLSVVSQKRFSPLLLKMHQKFLEVGGKATHAELQLAWKRDSAYYGKGNGWRLKDSAVMINHGIHWLDILCWFFGNPISIEAKSEVKRPGIECPDYSRATIGFERCSVLKIEATTFVDKTNPDQFKIHTSNGQIDYAKLKNEFERGRWIQRLLRRDLEGNLIRDQLKDFFGAIETKRPPTTTFESASRALKIALQISYPQRVFDSPVL